MILIVFAVLLLVANVAAVSYFTHRRGWSNFYILSLTMSVIPLLFITLTQIGA